MSSRVYLPAFAIAATAVILLAVGWVMGWDDASFADSAPALRVVVAGPLAMAIIRVFLVVERVWPAQRRSCGCRTGYSAR